MGFLAIAGGVAYGLLHYFWLRKVELKERDEDVTTAAAGSTACKSARSPGWDHLITLKFNSTALAIHN